MDLNKPIKIIKLEIAKVMTNNDGWPGKLKTNNEFKGSSNTPKKLRILIF